MRIEIDKQTLKSALRQPVKIAKTKKTFECLKGVKLEARDGQLAISATDTDTTIKVNVQCTIREEGLAVLNAAYLEKTIGSGTDTVTIEARDNTATVRAGSAKHTLPLMDAAEWPELTFHDDKYECTIGASELARLVKKSSYCTSLDESRPDFSGANFEVKDNTATMTATDGHRLATVLSNEANGSLPPCIVPRKALPALTELEGIVFLHNDGRKLHVKTDDFLMSICLINGKFPDFSKVIPKETNHTAEVEAKPLKDMLKSVSIASSKVGTIVLQVGGNQIRLNAENGKCRATAYVECTTDGDSIGIGINWEYVLQTIDAIGDSVINIGIVDQDSPVVLTGIGAEKHVVMPMQI